MKLPTWHRTKIICTLGPATDAPEVVEQMMGAGMDMARVNLSHGSHTEQVRRIAAERLGQARLRQVMRSVSSLINLQHGLVRQQSSRLSTSSRRQPA